MSSYLQDGNWVSVIGQLGGLRGKSQDTVYHTSEFALYSKITSLLLLAERITDEVSRCKNKASEEQQRSQGRITFAAMLSLQDPFFALEVDFEAFHFFIVSILDITAKLTAVLLDPTSAQLINSTRLYFSNQKQWLTKHRTLDSAYSDYLDKCMGWSEGLGDVRNQLAHELAAFVKVDVAKVTVTFYSADPSKRKVIDEVDTHVRDIMAKVYAFLSFYANHFA